MREGCENECELEIEFGFTALVAVPLLIIQFMVSSAISLVIIIINVSVSQPLFNSASIINLK